MIRSIESNVEIPPFTVSHLKSFNELKRSQYWGFLINDLHNTSYPLQHTNLLSRISSSVSTSCATLNSAASTNLAQIRFPSMNPPKFFKPTNDQECSRLFRLPQELRNAIYDFIFCPRTYEDGSMNLADAATPSIGLLMTCQAIYNECYEM